jgi:alkaline phosphatase D
MTNRRRSLLTRRELLAASAALGAVAAWPRLARPAAPAFTDHPFQLGLSSGFPTDRSVVLWTRLAPDPLAADGLGGMPPQDVALRWELAADEQFRRIERRGEIIASAVNAHSARVVVDHLQPARDYWYRFMAGDEVSGTARTRTLPAANRELRDFRIAIANCQHFEHGQWAAYRHIARSAPDLTLHIGDYIYEGATTPNRVRAHAGGQCMTLTDYRRRYAQYQMDPALQMAHAAGPWISTWDDHEVENDYSGLYSGRAAEPAAFAKRRAAAYQAYFEHLPLPPTAAPVDGAVALYASRRIGRLADLYMLDQRQYRSAQACPQKGRAGGNRVGDDCLELQSESRTMLGTAQETWFDAQLKQARGQWNLLAQGTVFSQVDEQIGAGHRYATDNWNGYPAARRRVLDALQRRRVKNPVIFSGDIHAFIAANIGTVPDQPDSMPLATEIVSASISSDARPQQQFEDWLKENPNLLLAEGRYRGYVALRLSPQRLQADLMALDDRDNPQSAQRVLQSLVIEAGVPKIQRA